MGGPNSDEGTESLVLYVYYNPFTVNIPILYKPVFTGGGYVGGYENAGKQGRGAAAGVVAAAADSAAMPKEEATASTNPPFTLHSKLPVHSNFLKHYLIS